MSNHLQSSASPWVRRFAPLAPNASPVLDVAAGGGGHGRLFLDRGHPVTFVDIDTTALQDIAALNGVTVAGIDLEDGRVWPFKPRAFGAVIVSNYLFRPHLPALIGSIAAGGVLIYETFALGNEAFGKPSNPDFLLKPGELLDLVNGELATISYEHGIEETRGSRRVRQRIAAIRSNTPAPLPDSAPSGA